jgi:hypothetical protein
MSVLTKATLRKIPEDGILHSLSSSLNGRNKFELIYEPKEEFKFCNFDLVSFLISEEKIKFLNWKIKSSSVFNMLLT